MRLEEGLDVRKGHLDIELLREGKESKPERERGKARGELVSIGEK